MRKGISAVGLTLAAMASAAVTAVPASASAIRPNGNYVQYINTYWDVPGGPDALQQCRNQGNSDTSSGNPFAFACDAVSRTIRNGTNESGWALYETFRTG